MRHLETTTWMRLIALIALTISAIDANGVILYRIGSPLSSSERDSINNAGIEFRKIDWSASQLQEALEMDSLEAGSLQPNFIDIDEDIAVTLLEREGNIWLDVFGYSNSLIGQILIDGDPTTDYTWFAVAPESFPHNARNARITLDLGGEFLIREVRFRPVQEKPEQFLERFKISVGNREDLYGTTNLISFPKLLEVSENTEPEVSVLLDPPLTTSAVQMEIYRQTPKELGLADIEVYGGGFVSSAYYETDIIELQDVASWGEISWGGRQDPNARVEIRTRTGTDPHPEIFWEFREEQQDNIKFLQGGGELTMAEYQREYEKLSDDYKPDRVEDRVSLDRDNWSSWSGPYEFNNPGVNIVSPSPNKYFQISVSFVSTVDNGGKIDHIEFKASVPPAVRGLIGEISPINTDIGRVTHFTYYIRPTIRSGDNGFDSIEISTPSGVTSVDSLRIGAINQPNFKWKIRDDQLGFEVELPRKLQPTDSGTLVEIIFNAPILREVGTVFEGRVFDSSKLREVRQRIIQGNASDDIYGNRLSVRTSLSRSLLFSPQITPNPFTPNADGVNDVATISYKLLRVTNSVPISVAIFDLSGQLVKTLFSGIKPFGTYSHSWDGTDNSNRLLPPGVYVSRIEVDLESEKEISSGVISLVY